MGFQDLNWVVDKMIWDVGLSRSFPSQRRRGKTCFVAVFRKKGRNDLKGTVPSSLVLSTRLGNGLVDANPT